MKGRLAVGLAGTTVVVLLWAGAGRDDGEPDAVPDPVATTAPPDRPVDPGLATPAGLVVVDLAAVAPPAVAEGEEGGSTTTAADEEVPGRRWEIDLAVAAGSERAAVCATFRGLRLSVLDRRATGEVLGLVLRGDDATAGVDVAVAGAFLAPDDEEVAVAGTARLDPPTEVGGPPGLRAGRLALTDDDGQAWEGTFRCQGPAGEAAGRADGAGGDGS